MLPESLLEPRQEPVPLTPQGTLVLPEPTNAIAPCPYFALEHQSTHAVLTASSDHPIHLRYAFSQGSLAVPEEDDDSHSVPSVNESLHHQSPPIASFRLIKRETEAYLPVASLIWPVPGTHFITGTTNRIAIFDISRPDVMKSEPLLSIPTIPSTRHISKGNGIGMRGTVAALAAQVREQGDAGLVAAGTWTRSLGLYDLQRAGECVATWNVAAAAMEAEIGGKGIVQSLWSSCGRYLLVNERGASGLLLYDLRGTNKLLAYLQGRNGDTNQRLSCDIFPGTDAVGGFEVWAGTANGRTVVWEGVGRQDGAVLPSWSWKGHESAVGSAAMHMSGSVVATCSGAWKIIDEEDTSNSDSSEVSASETETSEIGNSTSPFVVEETTLKVWSLGSGSSPEPTDQKEHHGHLVSRSKAAPIGN